MLKGNPDSSRESSVAPLTEVHFPKESDFGGQPILFELPIQQTLKETQKKTEARAQAKQEAVPYIPTLSDDHFVPGDAKERRLADQRHARTRLEEISKERSSLKFWNIFKKAELDQEAAKLQYILKSEELRAKLEMRTQEERRNVINEKIRLETDLRSVPDLQPAIDRIHALKQELSVAFDRKYKREEVYPHQYDTAAIDMADHEVDVRMKEWRRIEQKMENALIESFAELDMELTPQLLRDFQMKQPDFKGSQRPYEEPMTKVENLLRDRIAKPDLQKNPIKMRWAYTAADALAALRVLHGQTMREKKQKDLPPGVHIDTPETYVPSTDEELIALGEIDAPTRKGVTPKNTPRSFEDSGRDAVL